MAKAVLPTLSMDGWLDSGTAIMERIFFYWLTTNAHQSTFFLKQLESATHTLIKSESASDTKNDIAKSLDNLYSPFFGNLKISVDYTENSRGEVDYAIDISGVYDPEGKNEQCVLSKIVPVGDKRLLDLPNIIDLVTFYRSVKTNLNKEN